MSFFFHNLSLLQKKIHITFTMIVVLLVGLFLLAPSKPMAGTDKASAVASGTPTAFVMEAYETIDTNFWKDFSEPQLTSFFVKGMKQLTDQSIPSTDSREELRRQLDTILGDMQQKQRKEFPAELTGLVLRSLPPQGRSRLYTQKNKQELENRVQNVNPDRDLYAVLGVSKEATSDEIQSAYQSKKNTLQKKPSSTSTQKKLQEISYAKDVLTDQSTRKQYDKNKAEPTVFVDRVSDDIVHLGIHRYNRRMLEEFSSAVNDVSMQPKPNSLILDLRSNMGGSIDVLPYLLGPFIGSDQEAYRFFQQGDTDPYRTKTGWLDALVPYKRVVILVDDQTQSTGELMASVLKKYNVGTLVGETTRGWGTVERLFEINNQYRDDRAYSLFLVHHLTMRSDGQPIQDRGVVPEVEMNQSGWKEQLSQYMPHSPLIKAVETVWNSPPPGSQI